MYIITIHGKEKEGAYSVTDDDREQILYLFEEEDDAIRFTMMLEEKGSPEMHVIEVEAEVMIKTCVKIIFERLVKQTLFKKLLKLII